MGFLPNGSAVVVAREEDSRIDTKDADEQIYVFISTVGG